MCYPLSLHSVHTNSLPLLVSRSLVVLVPSAELFSDIVSLNTRRPPHTHERGGGKGGTYRRPLSRSCLFDPLGQRPRLDSSREANGSARGSISSLDILRPRSRLDALPIRSTTLGIGGQRRRRRGQEGESFIDEVRQQQSGSESDKGLDSSNDDHRRSRDGRITSKFTVQETGLRR